MINLLLLNNFCPVIYRWIRTEDELLYTIWPLVMVRNRLPAQEGWIVSAFIYSELSEVKEELILINSIRKKLIFQILSISLLESLLDSNFLIENVCFQEQVDKYTVFGFSCIFKFSRARFKEEWNLNRKLFLLRVYSLNISHIFSRSV